MKDQQHITATIRTVTIQMTSHLTDELWDRMFAEIEESVEQIACDYAVACENDTYRVDIVDAGDSGS